MIPYNYLPTVVAVVGSREFPHLKWVAKLVLEIEKFRPTIIVSGGARGVDSVAEASVDEDWFKPFYVTNKEWEILGKRSGHIRNEVLVFYLHLVGGCAIIFMKSGGTSGSKNVIENCKKYGVSHIVVHADKRIETFGFPENII